jgi:chorismate dehydratase
MLIRIGAVSYLNTKPLIYGLRERLPGCELRLDLPSRLADQLAAGELDVALIPSVEYLRTPGLRVVSNACIACRGAVRSVRLLLRKPASQIRSLALDEGSRTSAVLAQVLLARRFGRRPTIKPLPLQAALGSVEADALLVIGDRAMKLDGRHYVENWDLGEEWVRETGLPFVFAMWVAHAGPLPLELEEALQSSRDSGLAHCQEIAASEAIRYGLTTEDCLNYFHRQLHFELGPDELQGLELFRQWAGELDLLKNNCPPLSVEHS